MQITPVRRGRALYLGQTQPGNLPVSDQTTTEGSGPKARRRLLTTTEGSDPKARRRLLLWAEWPLLGLAAPLLLFPSRYTPLGLGLIAATWLIRRVATGRWSVPGPVHRPMLVLLLALFLSLVPSVRLDYSMPKFWGILYGMAIFYACLNTCRTEAALRRAAALLLIAGTLVSLVGVWGMEAPAKNIVFSPEFYEQFLRRGAVQTSTVVTNGFNSNEVGGLIALLLPIAVALTAARGWTRPLAIPLAASLLAALALTESRSAIAGVALALGVGTIWCGGKRGALLVTVALVLAAGASLLFVGPERLAHVVGSRVFASSSASLLGRLELWRRVLAMILDMPFTGVGLNNFPIMTQSFYPTNFRVGEGNPTTAMIPHAHNLFLQTALDLGLVGLGAFVALLILAAHRGLAAAEDSIQRPLAVGLVLGLLAHLSYGLTDAVALGAKPSPALWAVLGLLVSIGAMVHSLREERRRRSFKAVLPARWKRPVQAGVAIVGLVLLAAPLAINGALVLLHKAGGAAVATSPLLRTDLGLASQLGWGPYAARAWATEALAARSRADTAGEAGALSNAIRLGSWDPSLAYLLEELRLLQQAPAEAVRIRGTSGAVEMLLRRGRSAPPDTALELLARARAIEPTDRRPGLAAVEVLTQFGELDQAAATLAELIKKQGQDPARLALANRLTDPSAPLSPAHDAMAGASRVEAELFARAAQLLDERADGAGARYADQLALQADPSRVGDWPQLVILWDRLGPPALLREARAHLTLPDLGLEKCRLPW